MIKDCRVSVIWKDWISDLDFSKMVEPVLKKEIVEQVFREQDKDHLNSQDKLGKIMEIYESI